MLRIALTGGIASGKSTVAGLFEKLGVPVIHTDKLARKVVEPGSAGLDRITAVFGSDILTPEGSLDRRQLRELVFADASRRNELEEILHPLIRKEMEAELASLPSGTPYAIVEIPLLAETGEADSYDRVLVVDCEESVQRERLMSRDEVDEQAADDALNSQASREERLAMADDVIDNSSLSLDELTRRVMSLHEKYLQQSASAS